MLVLNGLEDQILLLVLGKIPEYLLNGFPYNDIFSNLLSTEPLFNLIITTIRYLFKENYVNISVLLVTILNLFFSYLFFKKYSYWFLGAFTFVFSSYYYIHLANHLSLMNTWLVPLFFILVDKLDFKSNRDIIILTSFLIFCILISNYVGLLIVITFVLYYFYDIINVFFINRVLLIRDIARLLFISFIILIFSLSLLSYFKNSEKLEVSYYIDRPIEDFYTFSIRPWYFFIPSEKSILYGDLAKNIISFFYSLDNYLTDDYFPKEHLALFFGYTTILLFLFCSIGIFRDKNLLLVNKWLKLFYINVILILLMLPPYITFQGNTIITPGYIFYKYLPMFRTIARFSILINFNLLIIILSYLESLNNKLNNKYLNKLKITLIITTIFILFEIFIPFRIDNYDKPPFIYEYIGNNYPGSNIFIYPYNNTQEALFWVDYHKSYLYNPKFYKRPEYDSESLTKNLNTYNGLYKVKKLGVELIVINKEIPKKELDFFINNVLLNKIYEDSAYILFKVENHNTGDLLPRPY